MLNVPGVFESAVVIGREDDTFEVVASFTVYMIHHRGIGVPVGKGEMRRSAASQSRIEGVDVVFATGVQDPVRHPPASTPLFLQVSPMHLHCNCVYSHCIEQWPPPSFSMSLHQMHSSDVVLQPLTPEHVEPRRHYNSL